MVNTGGTKPTSMSDVVKYGSDGTTSVNTGDEIISWNVSAIRGVSQELKSVAANFHDAHERCAVLVPRINEAWDSSLAAEKFEEKLDLGLVRHFEEGHAALTALANLLEQVAAVYEECENRIKNADYGVSSSVAVDSKAYTYSAEGFYNVSGSSATAVGGSVIDMSKLDSNVKSWIEKSWALGLPVGATMTIANGVYTIYDTNNNKLFSGDPLTGTVTYYGIEDKGSKKIEQEDGTTVVTAPVYDGLRELNMSELSEEQLANLKKIFPDGVSGDVDFIMVALPEPRGGLHVRIKGADGNTIMYKVCDGYLDMEDSMDIESQIAAQEERAAARQEANEAWKSDLEKKTQDEIKGYGNLKDTPPIKPVQTSNNNVTSGMNSHIPPVTHSTAQQSTPPVTNTTTQQSTAPVQTPNNNVMSGTNSYTPPVTHTTTQQSTAPAVGSAEWQKQQEEYHQQVLKEMGFNGLPAQNPNPQPVHQNTPVYDTIAKEHGVEYAQQYQANVDAGRDPNLAYMANKYGLSYEEYLAKTSGRNDYEAYNANTGEVYDGRYRPLANGKFFNPNI